MVRSALKGLCLSAIVSIATIAMPRPSFAHGGGGGAVGGGGIGGGPGSGAGGGIGVGGGIGGIGGISAGPVGSSPGIGGIGAGPGGAPGAIGGVVGPAPAVGGIGGGSISGAAGSAVTGALTGATPGIGSIGSVAGSGVPNIGTAGPYTNSRHGHSSLHEALYGSLGADEPTFGDVMQAGIRANSATESAVSDLPTLPTVAPPVEATAPATQAVRSQYAAALDPAPSRASAPTRVRHRAHHRVRRQPHISRPHLGAPLQTSIVPAATQ